jgi:hypothetical protein
VKRAVIVGLAGLLLSFSYVAVSASAGTPDYLKVNYPAIASFEPFTQPPSPTPEPVTGIEGCWDCEGSTMTEAEKLAAACTPAMLAANPQHLDLCFPDKWEWVCFPDGHCEMYRQDLDPLGIFATPPPMPTPEPLPTPVPTATPDPTPEPTPEPEPESTATPTP